MDGYYYHPWPSQPQEMYTEMAENTYTGEPYLVTIDENIPWQSPPDTKPEPSRNHPTEPPASKRIPQSVQAILHPRSFEDVFFERAYLISALAAQKLHVLDLVRLYTRADHELVFTYSSQEKRRLRKRRSLLLCKCNEALQQEMNVSARLNQVEMELLCREERNKLLELQHQQQHQPPYWEPTPSLTYSTTCTESTSEVTLYSLLDARSPEFIPAEKDSPPPPDVIPEELGTIPNEELCCDADTPANVKRWSLPPVKSDWADN